MQLIADNLSTSLYYDNADTENFYLYDKSSKGLTLLSFGDAKAAFQNGSFSWTLPGSNFFGRSAQNNLGNWYPQLNSPQPQVLISEDGEILTSDIGTILTP